jgi:DNA-binding transcriptional MocR family regulator
VTPQREGMPPTPEMSRPAKVLSTPGVRNLVFDVLESIKAKNVVPFGSAFPSPDLFPLQKLARALCAGVRRLDPHAMVEHLPPGNVELRRHIARRYMDSGLTVSAADVVITTGALEGLNLCLRAVAAPGDLIAIESPSFYSALDAVERYGMRCVEIPTEPGEGVSLPHLADALKKHPIKACWFMTNFQNPVGSLMPEDKKEELVRMLAARDVPLIEDDVYRELYFGAAPPKPAKAFDKRGLVLHCSSFSKCLAPGYRIGWVYGGRYAQQIDREKLMTTIATSMPVQAGIAEYLKHGGYDHHLRALRRTLAASEDRMLEAITREFPTGTRVSRPEGGYVLWVELPQDCDALAIYDAAVARGITLAPGPMFSPRRAFRHCIRLNYGMRWSQSLDAAMATLGRLIASSR